ncbi:MAG: hypothetical protein WDN75_10115 [Bacteroidota bacterium]
MQYNKELIIQAYDLLLGGEYQEWSIGCISSEEYFELRIPDLHYHCPCRSEDAGAVMDHFIQKGMSVSRYHKVGAEGILFSKEI